MVRPRRAARNLALTSVEQRIERSAQRLIARAPDSKIWAGVIEFLVFGAKQAWACVFGAAMLAVLLAARIGYPDGSPLARNDAITLAALTIQLIMIVFRLETLRELRVVITFHLVGTGMELFKTAVGSWSYDAGGVLHLGPVPLYSGFMYAAVGSYMVRVFRLFELRFRRYPPRWLTAALAVLVYANFFTHHYLPDLRWPLILATVLIFGRSVMSYRVFSRTLRMPLLLAFSLVALFIWLAENIATWAGAWFYPSQLHGWHPVSPQKLAAWFLLMIISVVLVTWVYPPQPPDVEPPDPEPGKQLSRAGAAPPSRESWPPPGESSPRRARPRETARAGRRT